MTPLIVSERYVLPPRERSMRTFKTAEELEQERQKALGWVPFRLPTDKILIIYARQSSKGQVFKRRESAIHQTEEQLEWALEMGWPQDMQLLLIENQGKDGKIRNASGRLRIDEREGLSTAMQYITSGQAGAVKVRDVARLFRDEDLVGPVVFAKACKDHHVIIITDDYTYNFNDPRRGKDDYKKFMEEAQVAADFLNKHVAMMTKYRKRKALRGEFTGSTVPTGLMLNDEREGYIANPFHAEAIKSLFKRFRALGGNLAFLRREVCGQPIFPDLPPEILGHVGKIMLTKVPGGWTIKTRGGLVYILTNPVYIGHMVYEGRIVKYNAHPAIVDEDDFWFSYYRLAKTDFEGNLIDHPEGMTKRYNYATAPYPALLSGLRRDSTPVVTTNIGPKSGVYVDNCKGIITYCVTDRSAVATWYHCYRITASRLDSIFSERLVYRVGEALKHRATTHIVGEQAAQLEHTYATIGQQLGEALQEAEQSEEGQLDPRISLEASIAETKKRIAERERVGREASSEMSGEDLRQHYASLKRLRASVAVMQQKLDRLETDRQEQAEATHKLPEVHERWAAMSIESKQRFIRAATCRIELDELAGGWAKLAIWWSPLLGTDSGDIIDEAYIWTTAGKRWTKEEKEFLRQHYATAERSWLLEELPEREWDAIIAQANRLRIERPKESRGYTNRPKDALHSPRFSLNDQRLIQKHTLDADTILEKRVYWREYVSLPIKTNGDERS
jgi:hypothetical protein